MENKNSKKNSEIDENKVANLIKSLLISNNLKHIKFLDNLVWNAIYIKENRPEKIASESRWDIENIHYQMLKELIIFLPEIDNNRRFIEFQRSDFRIKDIDESSWKIFLQTADWEYFEENLLYWHKNDFCFVNLLTYPIFKELKLEDTFIIHKSRNLYRKISKVKHPNENNLSLRDNEFKTLFRINFLLFLLYIHIVNIINSGKNFSEKLEIFKNFKLNAIYPDIINLSSRELLDFLINTLLGKKEIRELIFTQKIFTNHDIKNHTVLQNYFPLIPIENFEVRKVLNAKEISEFRVDGPHLIDFQEGNWIYIPKIVEKIETQLEQGNSVFITGKSGAGKTIISRYIGYSHICNFPRSNTYYFDFLDMNEIKSEEILDYLSRILQTSEHFDSQSLFIFDNIHILPSSLKKRLDEIKESMSSILIERNHNPSNQKKEKNKDHEYNFNFDKSNIFLINNRIFEDIRKGIIEKNIQDPIDLEQFFCLPFEDLWMFSFLIRIYKLQIQQNKHVNLRELILQKDLIVNELFSYFKQIFIQNSADFKYKRSQMSKILNHLRLILITISVFSEHEFWISKGFLDKFFSLKSGPVANYKENIQFDSNIISDILEFLVKTSQIKYRQRIRKDGFLVDEYRIPHSRLSKIYKNLLIPQNSEFEFQLLAYSLSIFRESNIYFIFFRILYPFYREKNDNVEERKEKYLPKIKKYIEELSPRISDSFLKIENINDHIQYLNTISYNLPEIWKIIFNNMLNTLDSDKFLQKKIFQQIKPSVFSYLLNHFIQSISKKKIIKILELNQSILYEKLNQLSIFEFMRLLLKIDTVFENRQKLAIIESIENKIFEIISRREDNDNLIIFYLDKVENGNRFFSEILNNNQKLIEKGVQTQITKLYRTLFKENYLHLDVDVSDRIFSYFSLNLSFLRQDLIQLVLENINNEDYRIKSNEILNSFSFYDLKRYILKFYDESSQFILKIENNEDRLRYIGKLNQYLEISINFLYKKASSGEIRKSARYNWIDMIIDFFNTNSKLLEKNHFPSITSSLKNNSIFNEFDWILSKFKNLELDFELKYCSQLFSLTDFEIVLSENTFNELKCQFKEILKRNLIDLESFSGNLEILINHYVIIKNYHIKSLEFFETYKDELLMLIYSKFFQEESHLEAISNILDFAHVNIYLNDEIIIEYIQNHNREEITDLLNIFKKNHGFYHKFVEKYNEILQQKLGEFFNRTATIQENIAYFQINCDDTDIQSIIKFIANESDNLIYTLSNHINPIHLEDIQFRTIYNWIIQKPSSEIINILHKFNYIIHDFNSKLHNMIDSRLNNLILKDIIPNLKYHFCKYLIEDDTFLKMQKPKFSLNKTYEWTRSILLKYISEHCDHFVEISLKNLNSEEILLVSLNFSYLLPNNLIESKAFSRKIHSFDLNYKKEIITRANQEITYNLISHDQELKRFLKYMGEWPEEVQELYSKHLNEYLLTKDNIVKEKVINSNVTELFLINLYDWHIITNQQHSKSYIEEYKNPFTSLDLYFSNFCQNLDLGTNFPKKFQFLNYIAYFVSFLAKNQIEKFKNHLAELYTLSMSEKFIQSLSNIKPAYILEYYDWFQDYFTYTNENHPIIQLLKKRFRNLQCIELIQLISEENFNERHIEILLKYFDTEISESASRYLKTTILHYKQFANLSIPEKEKLNYIERYFYNQIEYKLDDHYYFE